MLLTQTSRWEKKLRRRTWLLLSRTCIHLGVFVRTSGKNMQYGIVMPRYPRVGVFCIPPTWLGSCYSHGDGAPAALLETTSVLSSTYFSTPLKSRWLRRNFNSNLLLALLDLLKLPFDTEPPCVRPHTLPIL
ncbi:hypothetical protein M011DRAFT_10471 [Sporormia fimetaria CBS 119925]|uniref:Uncharacterized protein n=1 Tax=Sporormia fimetaria CBS 119925 TaxID=1340428 RepID=A0A6A6VRR2_9PLEO|nr:hypothetical protein M011DRAFT_10471 [Sporormia fimetaria CBS 119925]